MSNIEYTAIAVHKRTHRLAKKMSVLEECMLREFMDNMVKDYAKRKHSDLLNKKNK